MKVDIEKLKAISKPRSKEAIRKAEERKRLRNLNKINESK